MCEQDKEIDMDGLINHYPNKLSGLKQDFFHLV